MVDVRREALEWMILRFSFYHADVRPENVLIEQTRGRALKITLIDFGKTATFDKLGKVDTKFKSQEYVAQSKKGFDTLEVALLHPPEMLKGQGKEYKVLIR